MTNKQQHQRQRDPALGGLQCLSHFFNFILLIVGSGATALGFWIYFTLRMNEERQSTLEIVGLMFYVINLCPIAEGIFLVIVVLFGIIAICTMHRCTLIWYFSFVVVACVVSLMLTIMTFIVFFRLPTTIHEELHDRVQNEYGLFGKEYTTQLINDIQKSFKCCASKSHDEWRTSEWYKAQRLGYFNPLDAPVHPESCCVVTSEGMPANTTECVHINSDFSSLYIHKQSCSDQIHEWLHWYTLFMGCAGIAAFLATFFEVGATSALLHALGPLHYEEKPKAIDKQKLTQVHSESESDSWNSSQTSSMGRNPGKRPPNKDKPVRTLRKVTREDREARRKERKDTLKAQRQLKYAAANNHQSDYSPSNGNHLTNRTPIIKVTDYNSSAGSSDGVYGNSPVSSNGVYENSAFRHEADEATTPL